MEHGRAVVVGERDAPQLDATVAGRKRRGIRWRRHPWPAVEDLEYTGTRRNRALRHPECDPEHPNRRCQQRDVAVERDELANRDRPVDRLAAAHDEHPRETQVREEADERVVERAQPGRDHRLVEDPARGVGEPRQLALLPGEGLDQPDARDALLGLSRELGDPLLHLLAGGPVAPAVAVRGPQHEWSGEEGDPGEAGVHREHHPGRHEDRDRRLRDEEQPVAEEEAHGLQVHGGARHELPGLLSVEERDLERLQVRVHPVAEVELDAQRDAARDETPGHAEPEPEKAGRQQHADQRPEVGSAVPDPVDGLPDDERDQHAGAHRDPGECERHDDRTPVRA